MVIIIIIVIKAVAGLWWKHITTSLMYSKKIIYKISAVLKNSTKLNHPSFFDDSLRDTKRQIPSFFNSWRIIRIDVVHRAIYCNQH